VRRNTGKTRFAVGTNRPTPIQPVQQPWPYGFNEVGEMRNAKVKVRVRSEPC